LHEKGENGEHRQERGKKKEAKKINVSALPLRRKGGKPAIFHYGTNVRGEEKEGGEPIKIPLSKGGGEGVRTEFIFKTWS